MRNYIAGFLLAVLLIVAILARQPAQAATPANVPDVECYPWASTEGWTQTRCYDWNNGDVCIISSSGFQSCKFEGD